MFSRNIQGVPKLFCEEQGDVTITCFELKSGCYVDCYSYVYRVHRKRNPNNCITKVN